VKLEENDKATDLTEIGAEITVVPEKSIEPQAALAWRHLLSSAHEKSRVANWLADILGPDWHVSWDGDRLILHQQKIAPDSGAYETHDVRNSIGRSHNVICDGRRIYAPEPGEPGLNDSLAFAIAKIAKCVNWPKVEIQGSPGFQERFRWYALHDADFYNWTIETARVLEQQRPANVDWESLVEELEDLGISQERALQSHMRVLLTHLLKWVYEPARQSKSWKMSIENARDEVQDLLDRNPGLGSKIISILSSAYRKARRDAASETVLDEDTFPPALPWSYDQVIDDKFWPKAVGVSATTPEAKKERESGIKEGS
jgi:hypothetical protein